MSAPFETARALSALTAISHGFFGSQGGVSSGLYASLNASPSTGDDPDLVAQNRKIIAESLGGGDLVILKQTHSASAIPVDQPLSGVVEGDAMVSRQPGLLLAIQTADCTPILFADPVAGVIGAAHAGWRGAVDGIIGNTVKAMCALGASPENLIAAYGPTIWAPSYEVGPQFEADFLALHPKGEHFFFTPTGGKAHFDLPAFVQAQLQDSGITRIEQVGGCTYSNPDRYFSHRYATHNGQTTGRQLSVIGMGQR